MIDLNQDGEVFVLTMDDGENRWNTTFVREFAKALDEVEGSTGPAALVTTSSTERLRRFRPRKRQLHRDSLPTRVSSSSFVVT